MSTVCGTSMLHKILAKSAKSRSEAQEDLMSSSKEARGGPSLRNRIGFYGGPILAVLVLFQDLEPGEPEVTRMASLVVLMATWWITEALPVPVTALLPLVLLPLLGIQSADLAARYYFKSVTALLLGGFLLALAIERWGLHRRIAFHVLSVVGDSPRSLTLGFLLSSAFLSMWISNTATAMIMVPIALSVIRQVTSAGPVRGADPRSEQNIGLAILLAVAYGCSLGGTATLVGTPPNLVLAEVLVQTFPDAPPINFGSWLAFAWPFSFVFQILTWFLLVRVLTPVPAEGRAGGAAYVREELRRLGPLTSEERRVGAVFVTTALLWVFRAPIDFGFVQVPGWSSLLSERVRGFVDDGTVAVAAGIVLFALPAPSLRSRPGEPSASAGASDSGNLMNWETARRLPWGILILFGGGFALAGAMKDSGLSGWLGDSLVGLASFPPLVLVPAVALLMTFMTEVTSNTATTGLMLPVLAELARSTGIHPLLLMVPATLSASCAFMLPVATPPNAIVYGSGKVPIARMVLVGLVLNLLGVLLVTLAVFSLGLPLLGIRGFPDWAN